MTLSARARCAPLRSVAWIVGALFLLSAATSSAQAPTGQPLRALESGEMDRYLKVFEQLVDFGLEAQPMVESVGRGGLAGQASAMQYNARMQSAIESGGFTLETFSEVHWNAMMAYGAAELEKHRPEMEQARREQEAQMQAMRAQLPPEQYAQMAQAMGAIANMSPFGEVPPENLALIEQHRSELDRIIAKGER